MSMAAFHLLEPALYDSNILGMFTRGGVYKMQGVIDSGVPNARQRTINNVLHLSECTSRVAAFRKMYNLCTLGQAFEKHQPC